MNIEYTIINKKTNLPYKIRGKEVKYYSYKDAVLKIEEIKKNSNFKILFPESLIIREFKNNETKFLNTSAFYNILTGEIIDYKNSIIKSETESVPVPVPVSVTESEIDIIENEWNKLEIKWQNSDNVGGSPLDEHLFKINFNNKQYNNIINILLYIRKTLDFIYSGKEYTNEKLFPKSKEILVFFGEKLVIEIEKININNKKINEKYFLERIKYNY